MKPDLHNGKRLFRAGERCVVALLPRVSKADPDYDRLCIEAALLVDADVDNITWHVERLMQDDTLPRAEAEAEVRGWLLAPSTPEQACAETAIGNGQLAGLARADIEAGWRHARPIRAPRRLTTLAVALLTIGGAWAGGKDMEALVGQQQAIGIPALVVLAELLVGEHLFDGLLGGVGDAFKRALYPEANAEMAVGRLDIRRTLAAATRQGHSESEVLAGLAALHGRETGIIRHLNPGLVAQFLCGDAEVRRDILRRHPPSLRDEFMALADGLFERVAMTLCMASPRYTLGDIMVGKMGQREMARNDVQAYAQARRGAAPAGA